MVKPDQSAFLGSVVHELRAPLNACLMSVNLIELKASDPEVVLNSARVIRRNLERQAALIRDLSDVVQIASDAVVLAHEPVSVDALIDGAIERAGASAAERGIEVRRSGAEIAQRIETDAERAAQVLGSFLEHLIAGSRTGERVEVEARVANDEVEIEAVRHRAIGGEEPPPSADERAGDQKGFGVRLLVAEYLLDCLGGRCERRADGFSVRLPAR